MGYSVYWAYGRWQGYGVPAPCDYPGCEEMIDRGIGYQHGEDKEHSPPSVFTCSKHENSPWENFEINLDKESPEWLLHVLSDNTWEGWRNLNPDMVKKYESLLNPEGDNYNE